MDAEETLVALLSALPDRKIAGKKRVQKLVHLLKVSGFDISVDFKIHHYGPFSYDLADALEDLAVRGVITEQTNLDGAYDTYQSSFLYPQDSTPTPGVDPRFREKVHALAAFSTVELEVASTVFFFEEDGASSDEAVNKTRSMKKSKTIPPVLEKVAQIRDLVSGERAAFTVE